MTEVFEIPLCEMQCLLEIPQMYAAELSYLDSSSLTVPAFENRLNKCINQINISENKKLCSFHEEKKMLRNNYF